MNDEQLFRFLLLAGFVIFTPVAFSYRWKSRTKEKLDRRQEGVPLLVGIRLLGLVGMSGFIAYLINPAGMAWAAMPLPKWLRWSGLAFGLLGASLIIWTFHNLGKNLTDTVVTRKEHTLVTSGPYRWIRHPF